MVSKPPLSDDPIINYSLTHQDLSYWIMCYWGPRADTPERLAPRFMRTLEALSRVHPAFSDWQVAFYMRNKELPLASLSSADVVEAIVEGIPIEEGDTPPLPADGYWFGAGTGRAPDRRDFYLSFHAGNVSEGPTLANTARLESYPLCPENASLITLDVLKPALLVLVSQWKPTWCGLAPLGFGRLEAERLPRRGRPSFRMKWVTYLSPRFAPMVTPPPTAIAEYLPDGGLLMFATEERFDKDNPRHLAVARDIEEALAPVNALPWPPDP